MASRRKISIVVAGAMALLRSIPTEVFPEFELDLIMVSVPYRGSTPAEGPYGGSIRSRSRRSEGSNTEGPSGWVEHGAIEEGRPSEGEGQGR